MTLAGTGVAIWDALARPRPAAASWSTTLATRFGADRDRVAWSTSRPVLDDLLAGGVLETVA